MKKQCKRGHLFTTKNTYIRPNGSRMCRRCAAERKLKKYYEEKKQ